MVERFELLELAKRVDHGLVHLAETDHSQLDQRRQEREDRSDVLLLERKRSVAVFFVAPVKSRGGVAEPEVKRADVRLEVWKLAQRTLACVDGLRGSDTDMPVERLANRIEPAFAHARAAGEVGLPLEVFEHERDQVIDQPRRLQRKRAGASAQQTLAGAARRAERPLTLHLDSAVTEEDDVGPIPFGPVDDSAVLSRLEEMTWASGSEATAAILRVGQGERTSQPEGVVSGGGWLRGD